MYACTLHAYGFVHGMCFANKGSEHRYVALPKLDGGTILFHAGTFLFVSIQRLASEAGQVSISLRRTTRPGAAIWQQTADDLVIDSAGTHSTTPQRSHRPMERSNQWNQFCLVSASIPSRKLRAGSFPGLGRRGMVLDFSVPKLIQPSYAVG